MKKIVYMLLLGLCLFTLVGCGSSQQYKVVTSDGQEFVSMGQPDYDKGQNVYTFEDDNGKAVTVNKDNVEFIREYDPPSK